MELEYEPDRHWVKDYMVVTSFNPSNPTIFEVVITISILQVSKLIQNFEVICSISRGSGSLEFYPCLLCFHLHF